MPTDPAPQFATARDPSRATLGPKVASLIRVLDGEPMPWQRQALDVACEIDPSTGQYWYRNVIVIVPRQAGKTTVSRAKVTHRCLTTAAAAVLYTAQDRNKSRRRLEKSFYDPIHQSALAPVLARPRWAAGSEAVRFVNRSEIFIDAPTKKQSAHGETIPEAHIDEAFAHVDARIEQAVSPTMITVTGAQKWITSAAGDEASAFLWGKVEAGRALIASGLRSRTCYIEFSAPEDADRDDPATVLGTHPAIGWTIGLDTIIAEKDQLDTSGPAEFDRAYLGWWPRATEKAWAIPKAAWLERAVAPEDVDWTGEPVWSIDISPERDAASITLAGRSTAGRVWLEVVAHDDGETWLIPHMRKLRRLFGGEWVALDGSGPAGALEPELEEEGFRVRRLSLREKVDACGALHRAVLAGTVEHGGDPVLDDALAAAAKRTSGDGWVWARGTSLADITALYGVTLARWLSVELASEDYDVTESVH